MRSSMKLYSAILPSAFLVRTSFFMMATSFSATLAQHAGFRAVIELVSAAFDDTVCLDCKPAGISVHSVDKAQSSYLDAFFDSAGSGSVFKNYKCAREHLSLYLNPKHLARLLKATAAPSKQLLTNVQLWVAEAEDRLSMRISSLSKLGLAQTATINIALLDAETGYERVVVDGSEFTFTAEAMTSTPQLLEEVIAQLKASGCDEVELTLSEDCLVFASRGPDLATECEIALAQHSDGAKLCLAADPPCSLKFSFKYFERLAKLAAVSTRLLLQLGADAPLSINAELAGGGWARLFLAPITEID